MTGTEALWGRSDLRRLAFFRERGVRFGELADITLED